jgi:hypothetical protein
MLQSSVQFTPQQLLESGRRAEGEGRFDLAGQFYRYLIEHHTYTAQSVDAREALARIGGGEPRLQSWYASAAAAEPASGTKPPAVHGNPRKAALRQRNYKAGRLVAAAFSGLGWLVTLSGLGAWPLYLFMGSPILEQSLVPFGLPSGWIAPAAVAATLVAAGLIIVFWGQLARAVFDQANAARELVSFERDRLGGGSA